MALHLTPHELADLIGADAMLALIEAFAGRRVFVPARVSPNVVLAKVLGADALSKIVAEYGGNEIKVPLARNWRIRLYRARGKSYAEIAEQLGVTEKTVWQNLNRAGMTGVSAIEKRRKERLAKRQSAKRGAAASSSES